MVDLAHQDNPGDCLGDLSAQHLDQRLAEPGRRGRDLDARLFHCGNLRRGVALATRDDGAGVPHAAAGRRRAPGDEADHRLLAAAPGLVLEELRRVLLGRAADLADHDDRFSCLVGEQHLQHLDELGALPRVAADADRGGLAEPLARGLEHRLIGQGARARHDADLPGLEDRGWHDADLALACRHHARAIGPNEARLRSAERALHLDHVSDRDALGDADDERDLSLDRLRNGIGSTRRRHVDYAGVAIGLRLGFGNRIEHRQPEMAGAAFTGRSAAHHLGAVGDRLLGVERAVLAGEALADDAGVLVDQDGHQAFVPFTAFTIFCAASSRSSAAVTLRLDLARMSLPSFTLVPSSRTTSGTRKPTSRTASTTPAAITSHFMMPPKMLIRIPFTLGSEVMILNAAATFSLLALPPTSRKFAGSSP